MGSYDVAEICINGHVSNCYSGKYPSSNKKFCEKCGEKTIKQCECGANIRGEYYSEYVVGGYDTYERPAYCISCGKPYPWTLASIQAAEELADLIDEFSDEEREIIKKSLHEIVRDTPRTTVEALKFKRVVSKISPNLIDAFKNILFSALSDPVNKSIWGP